jgi:hypothetical protein
MARKHSAPSISFFAFQDIITSVVGIFVLITLIMVLELADRTVVGSTKGNQVEDTLSATVKLLDEQLQSTKELVANRQQAAAAANTVASLDSQSRREELKKELMQIEERRKKFESKHIVTSQANTRSEGTLRQLEEQSIETKKKKDELKLLLAKLNQIDTAIETFIDNSNVFRQSNLGGRSITITELRRNTIDVTVLQSMKRTTFSEPGAFEKWKQWVNSQNSNATHFLILVRPGGSTLFSKSQKFLNGLGASYGFDVTDDTLAPAPAKP